MKKSISPAKILEYDVIFEEAEEGGYMVYTPALPGCVSEGDTFEEAKDNITEAISAYLESVAKEGQKIPDNQNKSFFFGKIAIPLANLIL